RQPTSTDMQEDLDTAVLQHDQIIDAIERHNAGEAGELIRVHMDLSRRRMTEYVIPAGIDVPLTY
ncbi:GntR family transcriptional regulator, partial [Acinetobacter baumannii]|nr:GntR family transcriptional regulator [Acinetobacter baumannii]